MTPARILTAVLIALASTAICWVALDLWAGSGGNPPPLSWVAVFVVVALVLVVIAAGLPVRRWMHGQRERVLDPLVAARTAVLAKAAAYGGALIGGWYLSQAVLVLPDLVGARRQRFIIALVAAALAAGLSVAGFVVQRWCKIPPEGDSQGPEDPDRDSVL
jgi:Protein of unknown function (DUF3180)